jgi:hypothetical protein
MPGVRVYQLAKELKVQSALIVELLDRLGKEVHSDLSSIDDVTASLVRERLTVALAVEKKRLADERRTDEPIPAAVPADEPAAAPAVVADVELFAPPVSEIPAEGEVEVPARVPAAAAPPAEVPKPTPPPAPQAAVPVPLDPQRPRVFAAKRLVPKMVPPRTAPPSGYGQRCASEPSSGRGAAGDLAARADAARGAAPALGGRTHGPARTPGPGRDADPAPTANRVTRAKGSTSHRPLAAEAGSSPSSIDSALGIRDRQGARQARPEIEG